MKENSSLVFPYFILSCSLTSFITISTRIHLVYSPHPAHVVEIYFLTDMIDSGSLLVLAAELARYAMKVAFNETHHTYRGWAIKAMK